MHSINFTDQKLNQYFLIFQVDNFQKVGKMVRTDKTEEDNKDVGCVLIQNTKTDEKTDESANDFINNYYSMLANQTPVVALPDWGHIISSCDLVPGKV